MSTDRETAVSAAFVALASDLANGRDVVDMLSGLTETCAQLLDISSAGLLLADRRKTLRLAAASSEETRALEVFQLQSDQGPCLDCYRDGIPVTIPDLRLAAKRWPKFVLTATGHGFRSVHAVPLRLHDQILGTLGMFGVHPGSLNSADLSLAQAFADVASVALIQDRTAADSSAVNSQLQFALDSRIAIEQAKGVLAQYAGLDMPTAFAVLRSYARHHNLRLADLARSVTTREVDPTLLTNYALTHPTKA
jgi:GAF domain-containing protein